MKKVLYISNIIVPYRVKFFNQLAQHCDLTVLYERKISFNRSALWTGSETIKYHVEYLNGIRYGNENSFSPSILKYVFRKFDCIILGCYDTPTQILANLAMRMMHRPFALNFDGEVFAEGNSIQARVKKFLIKGASWYLTAGQHSAKSVQLIVGNHKNVYPYFFSSLTQAEITENRERVNENRENYVLVIGQYFPYKGLDLAVEAARRTPEILYKFVGMGNRTNLFLRDTKADRLPNITVTSFLDWRHLSDAYQKCRLLLLPSRRECWGLVVNEAASFGTPIVSTDGSGAALEFLAGHPEMIAKHDDADGLTERINKAYHLPDYTDISHDMLEKTKKYTIEHSVMCHIHAIEKEISF